MDLVRRFTKLLMLVALVVVSSSPVSRASVMAQPFTPGAAMLEQDERLGPGCNEIGLGMPTSNLPLSPSQDWSDAHSVCVGDRLMGTGTCYGVTDGAYQVELCVFVSLHSDGSMAVDCADFVLDTEFGVFGPHAELTDSLAGQAATFTSERNLPSALQFQPCTRPVALGTNTFVFAAFDGLQPTTDPVVLRVNVETGQFVAFVADEPTLSLDALQS